ncbi:DMT family transporter [Brevibacillus sp. SYSU BS000544]|uniref:DMT family transporter n=1 Tax=Brevibacillus sp. SYSU BS000544 TaxID=3416443 RepID=UPI003CE5407D
MKKSFIADLTLFFIALIWGATFVVVQNAVEILPPNTFNSVRFGIAALFLFIVFLLFSPNKRSLLNKQLVKSGAFLGLWLFGGYALQTVGLLYTSPSKAGFITGLCVVLVPLFSFLLLKDKIKWPATVGVIMAVFGLYLLTTSGSLALNLGDMLVFGCAICFALQIVLTGKFAPKYDALPLAITQIGSVAVLSFLYALFFEDWQAMFDPQVMLVPDVAWGLFITSIPATALAFLAQTSFQKYTTSTRVALIFSLEPVFAAITSYLWIHEILTGLQILGCTLIFSGMIFAELPISAWIANWRGTEKNRERSINHS